MTKGAQTRTNLKMEKIPQKEVKVKRMKVVGRQRMCNAHHGKSLDGKVQQKETIKMQDI